MTKIKMPSYTTKMMLSYILLALVASALGIGSAFSIGTALNRSQSKLSERTDMTKQSYLLHRTAEKRRTIGHLFVNNEDSSLIEAWDSADQIFTKTLTDLSRMDDKKSFVGELGMISSANKPVRQNWKNLVEKFRANSGLSVDDEHIKDIQTLEGTIVILMETDRQLIKVVEAEALGDVNQTLILTVFVSALVLASSLGMAFYISSTLKKPLQKLFKATKRISRGELGHKIDLDRPDEIGDLTSAFDEMSTELRLRERKIDKHVNDLQSAKDLLETYSHDLEFKNKELESFIYSVSHDLKAPLIAIQGFLTMFANEFNEKLSNKAHFYLSRVRVNSEQMHALIRQLLELSRVGENNDTLQNINMQTLVDETLDDLSLQLESKRAKVRLVGDWPEIVGYPLSVKQALRNLVDNALHYKSKSRRLEIEIGVEETSSFWHLYVRDNGMGVDPMYHEKIFDLFERAGISQTMNEHGTGMGLAIVRKIAEHHGGTVGIKSKLNNGSTFFFEISKDIAMKEEAKLEV